VEGGSPAGVLLGAHYLGWSRDCSRDREAAEVTAGRAEKRKEAERAVLAVSSGGESHLYSRRLVVSQGLIAKRSGHLVGESPRRGTPKGVSSAEGVLVRDTS
jgi:hypothetical protein